MTEEEMKEFQGFSKEIDEIRIEMDKIVREGFTDTTLKRLDELIARQETLIAKQKAFGRKHGLLP